MAKQFTLGKNERLKSRKQIEHLFSKGQRFVSAPFRVFYSFQPGESDPSSDSGMAKSTLLAGFSASSRIFKTAVGRNKIKRLTKEAYRLQKNSLQDKLKEQNLKLNVFFIYTGKELPMYADVHNGVGAALTKLQDLAKKKI